MWYIQGCFYRFSSSAISSSQAWTDFHLSNSVSFSSGEIYRGSWTEVMRFSRSSFTTLASAQEYQFLLLTSASGWSSGGLYSWMRTPERERNSARGHSSARERNFVRERNFERGRSHRRGFLQPLIHSHSVQKPETRTPVVEQVR